MLRKYDLLFENVIRSKKVNYLLRRYVFSVRQYNLFEESINLLRIYEVLFRKYEPYEFKAKVGASPVVETMSRAKIENRKL